MSFKNSIQLLAGLALMVALAGCGETTVASRFPAAVTGRAPTDLPVVEAQAGIDLVEAKARTSDVITIAKSMYFASRPNDFALGPGEAAFDQEQKMLNFFGQAGGYFGGEFELPDERPVSDEIQRVDVPMWRLSGVVIGESVSALLERGPGQTTVIRPGMIVDGWMCVSIDSQKAVFRRMDNAEPNTMEVRRSLPMGGLGGTTGGGGGTGGRTTGGGGPSAQPGRSGGGTGGQGTGK